ncbi:uncharacterized protein METZ01_LOCUS148804 [marine metagenome]|jgi:hypothetical protein|uniref:Uncharacterized protein n=1 Tax=marine metagenome TaxID=408172 RepID=A0A382A370_9ZZZZ
MAEEITVSGSLQVTKDGVTDKLAKVGLSIDMSGGDITHRTQTVGTGEEALGMLDAGTPGLCLIKNLDSTNYVEVRQATGVADLIRINAGEFALFRFAADATAPFVIANTGNVIIEYLLIEA